MVSSFSFCLWFKCRLFSKPPYKDRNNCTENILITCKIMWPTFQFYHVHTHCRCKNVFISTCKFSYWKYSYSRRFSFFFFPEWLSLFMFGFSKHVFATYPHRIIFEFNFVITQAAMRLLFSVHLIVHPIHFFDYKYNCKTNHTRAITTLSLNACWNQRNLK